MGYRDCSESGNPASVAYITGMDTNYTAGWAQNPSKSALLDAATVKVNGTDKEATNMALQAACDGLLTENQVGEIYKITKDPNCTNCMRIAIYNASAGVSAGQVPEEGAEKWVCQKKRPPMATPMRDCPTTTSTTSTTTTTTTTSTATTVTVEMAKVTYTISGLNY